MNLMIMVSDKSIAEIGDSEVVTLLATKTQILSAPRKSSPREDTHGDSCQLALHVVAATKLNFLITY
jgi:hypothetical protein